MTTSKAINEDKLTIVYEPTGAAREYAKLALNIYKGCTHGCIYCYNNGRFGKKGDFFKGAKPKSDVVRNVIADCRQLKDCYGESCPEIHLTFLGDAYQSAERSLGLTRSIIRQTISFDLPFTILTKSASIERDIDLLAPYRKFRAGFSFTTVNQEEASQWEPGTGPIQERINALFKFKARSVKTWVSLEPVMSVESTIKTILKLHPRVDFYRIGALNHMDPPEPIDLVEAHRRILEILEFRHCNYEFKKSFTDL